MTTTKTPDTLQAHSIIISAMLGTDVSVISTSIETEYGDHPALDNRYLIIRAVPILSYADLPEGGTDAIRKTRDTLTAWLRENGHE